MLIAIYKYIFPPFTVCVMILKNKNLFFLLSPDYVWSHLYKYITEPLLYPQCTRPTCVLLVSTVKTIILPVSVTFSVYLNTNHGRLFKKFTDVCVL